MFGNLGFSYIGLLFLLMLFIPNIMWSKRKPQGYTPIKENKILLFFERLGEVLTCCCSLVFSDFNIHKWTLGIPLAGAALPVIAFFMLGIYGKVVFMLIAAFILGIGHIGIHIQHKFSLLN
ncbi:hypothetical protein IMSAGC018_01249 [Lachnospiraceae bacterium]|nr:hypothetical protein IMSAGC018_01249 [Lachnospiraceae bacterium]